ncbi:MAG TPA: sll0787 family AIR synthase-like protein [Thermodesulfobacteriota bacterium]|nr:sll0787 family AIR synthase-like protein [Thermodesulfobacteriota bacterium]
MRELISALRSSPRLSQKGQLRNLWHLFPQVCKVDGNDVILGDDAAAIKTPDGYLLLAAEGVYPPLLKSNPYLSGRTSVLTNVNDIYAMGGRPLAILDVLFASDSDEINEALRGINDNASRYRVPVVGGHLTEEKDFSSLSVFILGKAKSLISGFSAKEDDDLIFAFSPNGKFYSGFNFWDSSSNLSGEEALMQLELLPQIAEEGLADAGKDVSMAGLIGSVLMLLECSGKGADIYIDKIPAPLEVPLKDWLLTFPSFGFILSLRPQNTDKVEERFKQLGLAFERIGKVTTDHQVFLLSDAGERNLFWDFGREPLIGFADSPTTKARRSKGGI